MRAQFSLEIRNWAAEIGDKRIVEALLAAGAKPNLEDVLRETASVWAKKINTPTLHPCLIGIDNSRKRSGMGSLGPWLTTPRNNSDSAWQLVSLFWLVRAELLGLGAPGGRALPSS